MIGLSVITVAPPPRMAAGHESGEYVYASQREWNRAHVVREVLDTEQKYTQDMKMLEVGLQLLCTDR
jgi:hypothetical protein